MTLFVTVNWSLCILTSLVILLLWSKYKSLFIKPSILIISYFHVILQWSAAFQSAEIERYLPNPFDFAVLVHGFPLIGLYLSCLIGRRGFKKIWKKLDNDEIDLNTNIRLASILGLVSILIIIFYFQNVPFSRTGLHAILFEPEQSAQAREESLKLIGNVYLKYAYSFMTSAFAPILSILLTNIIIYYIHKRNLLKLLVVIGCLLCLLLGISLTGARSYSMNVILTIFISIGIRKKFRFSSFNLITVGLISLILPTTLTVLREGRELNFQNWWETLSEGIFQRVFIGPLETGIWHVHYAQTKGLIGIAGIDKLASFLGIQPINVPNLIGLTYYSSAIKSISANTCFVFAYYSYFGFVSLFIVLAFLSLTDLCYIVYKRLNDTLLIPCMSSITLASLSFIASDYTVVLISHGFLTTLITALILNRLLKQKNDKNSKLESFRFKLNK